MESMAVVFIAISCRERTNERSRPLELLDRVTVQFDIGWCIWSICDRDRQLLFKTQAASIRGADEYIG